MRPFNLHTKTAIVASLVTLFVMGSTLVLFITRISDLVREDQKFYAELQAISLAQQINKLPSPRDYSQFTDFVAVVRGSRPNIVTVQIWERTGNTFLLQITSEDNRSNEELPNDVKKDLINGIRTKTESKDEMGNTLYRAFVPLTEGNKVSGAVEVAERLEDTKTLFNRFAKSVLILALIAVALMLAATYFLFRHLIYLPLGKLLNAMQHAKAGELDVQAEVRGGDEIGQLTKEFNSMISKLDAMTKEREAQKEILQERVSEATAELQHRNEQLEEINLELWRTTRRLTELERLAAAGQTAAQFAHEVGTPLNLISGHVQLLRASSKDNPSTDSRLQTIATQIERIERIVRQMLDRTRFNNAEMTLLDINILLKQIFDTTAPEFESRGVRLSATLNQNLPRIYGNSDRLQQVFINLINNALDAMPKGGELRVFTSANCDDKKDAMHVCVDIADTGIGMNNDVKAHIFDPLFTTKKRGKGTGLGLVIAKQVMQEHGGEIEVESEPDEGARFRLRFPTDKELS